MKLEPDGGIPEPVQLTPLLLVAQRPAVLDELLEAPMASLVDVEERLASFVYTWVAFSDARGSATPSAAA